ncbi:MAG: PAS domain S-box protein, partial [Bacteroidota bacterium]|nr:PAS domain S-box protein [Bacteroidota bacterium]
MRLQELASKAIVRNDEASEKRVRVFLQSSFYILNGDWQWEMETDAVFCSDVMFSLQEDFVGTKGIFHPDDVAALKEALTSGTTVSFLSFRIITTYGEVKTLTGDNIAVSEEVQAVEAWQQQSVQSALKKLEQKEATAQLQILKDINEKTSRFSNTGNWYYNLATHQTWYSDFVYHLHGLPAQSLNAHLNTFHPFVHPDDKAVVIEYTDKAFQEKTPLHMAYRIVVASTEKWVSYKAFWFYSEKGEAILGGIFQDITEQKTAEKEIELYRNLVQFQRQQLLYDEQQVSFGHWQVSLLTRKTIYSDQYYRIFGLKPQSLSPTINAFLNHVHPDDREKVEAMHKQVLYEHAVPDLEYRIIRNDGKTRYILQKAKMLMAEDELMMSGIIQDVTVQRMLERKVAELHGTLQLAQWQAQLSDEQSGMVTWVMDLDENTIYWSDSFYKFAAVPKLQPASITEKTLFSVVHPYDQKSFRTQWTSAVQKKEEASFDVRFLVRGVVQFMTAAFRFYQHNGKDYFIGTLKNNTAEQVLQQQLSQRVQLAESLSENTLDSVIITDTHNTILLWNRSCEQRYGIKKNEAVGQNYFDLFPHLKSEETLQLLQRVQHGEKAVQEGLSAEGTKGYYTRFLMPLYQGAEVSGVLHIIHDVTRETELRNSLHDRLQLIEGLVQSSVDRIIALDNNLNYLYWNKRAEEYYGLQKGEVLGKNILEVFPGLVNDPSYGEIRRALRGETVYIPVTPEANVYFETYLIPVKNEKGEVLSLLWMAHDLSKEWQLQQEQQEAQEQIREQAHFLRRISETVPDMVSVMELATRKLQYLNKELFIANGFDPDNMANKSREELIDLIHPDDRHTLGAYYESFSQASDDEIKTAEYRAMTTAGEWKWFHVRGKVFQRSAAGVVTHVLNAIENITDRKKAEQEILQLKDEVAQKATDNYLALFNSIDEGFYRCEVLFDAHNKPVDIRYLEENPAAVRILGKSILGKTLREVDKNYEDHWFQVLGEVVLTGESKRMEHYSEPDKKWFDFYVTKVGDAASRQVTVVYQDVTERKRAEEALRQSEAQLTALFEAVPVGIGLLDGNGQLIFSNTEMQRFLPTKRMPSLDDNLFGSWLAYDADGRRLERHDYPGARALRGERVVPGIEMLYTQDESSQTWTRVAAVPIMREDKIIGAVAAVTDINKLKQSAEALQDLNARFTDILESTSDAFYALDQDFNFTYVNKKAAQLWRRSPETLIGRHYWTEFPVAVGSESYQKHHEVLKEKRPVHFQTISPLVGIWIEVSIYPGKDGGMSVFFRDITERKQAEENLKNFTSLLEEQIAERTKELQKNLAILQHTEELAQIGSWEYEIASGNFNWSEGMFRLFGLPEGTMVRPETYLDFATEADRAVARRIIKNLKKNPQSFEETIQIKRGGDIRLLKIKGSVVNNENGQPQRILGADLDITDIQQAEKKVAETRHWLEQTALASPDAITIYDLQKKQPFYLNNCLANWLGTTNEALVNMGIDGRLAMIYEDDRLRL